MEVCTKFVTSSKGFLAPYPQTWDLRLKINRLSFIYTCKGIKSFDEEMIITITGDIKSPNELSNKLPSLLQLRFFFQPHPTDLKQTL